MKAFSVTILITALLLALSCNSEQIDPPAVEIILPESGIEIADAWARPGRINGVSAIYMTVLNGSAETDTLISLSSSVAGLVELHETYELADDMMGMREAEEPIFPARSVVSMRPGGLHVMLMQLNEALNEGDEVELILNFSIVGEQILNVPVRSAENRH